MPDLYCLYNIEDHARYDAYLYSQVSKKDLYYLEDIELASQLVELG